MAPLRIGLVATDPLRIAGLQAIVDETKAGILKGAEIVPLSVPGILRDAGLRIVVVDAACTDHLLVLIETFCRVRPLVRLVVIGEDADPAYVQQIVGAGAKGYLTRTANEAEIRLALEIVNDGSIWAPRKVLARLLDASNRGADATPSPQVTFTDRELQVLRLLVTGLGNREIAESLAIDESTVKAHLSRLMRKVGAKNRIGLTLEALRHDLGTDKTDSSSG